LQQDGRQTHVELVFCAVVARPVARKFSVHARWVNSGSNEGVYAEANNLAADGSCKAQASRRLVCSRDGHLSILHVFQNDYMQLS
jgi:hypothetical protein